MRSRTDAEKLEKLRALMRREYERDGMKILEEPYYDIEGVLQDLTRGCNDEVCHNTLRRVQRTLAKMHDVLWDSVMIEPSGK
jgi:hypothetical protein